MIELFNIYTRLAFGATTVLAAVCALIDRLAVRCGLRAPSRACVERPRLQWVINQGPRINVAGNRTGLIRGRSR